MDYKSAHCTTVFSQFSIYSYNPIIGTFRIFAVLVLYCSIIWLWISHNVNKLRQEWDTDENDFQKIFCESCVISEMKLQFIFLVVAESSGEFNDFKGARKSPLPKTSSCSITMQLPALSIGNYSERTLESLRTLTKLQLWTNRREVACSEINTFLPGM